MTRKNRLPSETDTQPSMRRAKATTTKLPAARSSTPMPKSKRERAERATEPPPRARRSTKPSQRAVQRPDETRTSGVQPRRAAKSRRPAAVVDEVVADLSRDPRREDD